MLDKFRETAITWDKANRKVYEPLRVSAGDNKGRKLSVQVVNGGVVENITGSSLSLFWETRDKAHRGLDVFTAVDATKGEFEIYYTTGMLSNEGVLNANLVLVDTSGRVVSEPFTITVFKGIDDNAIQSSDSFTALTEALIDISDLEQNYAPRLNDLTAQLQQTATKTELNVEKARIDTFTSLPVGSTTGDAELIDGRVGADGFTYDNLGDSIRGQISDTTIDLKNAVKVTNKLSFGYVADTLITQNSVTNPVGFFSTDFIRVKPSDFLHIYKKASRTNFYNKNKVLVNYAANDISSVIVPVGAYYVRFSWYIGDTPINDFTVHVGSFPYNNTKYVTPINSDIAVLKKGKNRFNVNDLLDGYNFVSGSNGNIVATTYHIKASKPILMPRFAEEKYVTISTSNTLPTSIGYRFLNSSGTVIDYGNYNGLASISIEIPVPAKYVQVSYDEIQGETTPNLQVEYGQIASIYEEYAKEYTQSEIETIALNVTNSNPNVEITPTGDIMDFYKSMLSAYNTGNCDVYVRTGDYIYTDAMIETIRALGKRGVPIGNGCRYYFDTNAKIICNYRGANQSDIQAYFSPLDSWNVAGSWEIHNLTLEASCVLYGLHDECSGSSAPYTHLYDNCSIILDNTGYTTGYNRAIGGGLGANAEIIMRNCIFDSISNVTVDVTYHGNSGGDDAHIAITNCYFGKALGIDGPTGTGAKRLIFSGNSCKTEIVRNDTENMATWNILSWGNTLRN